MTLTILKIMKMDMPTGKTKHLLKSFYLHSAPAEDLVQWPFNHQQAQWITSKNFAFSDD